MQVSCRFFPIFSALTRRGYNLVQAPVPARVSAVRSSPGLAITAGHHRGRRVSAPKLLPLHFACTATTAARCLTPRSSRAPTACHAGPAGGTQYIFASRARASHRRCRLNSNVRQHDMTALVCHYPARPSGLAFTHSPVNPGFSLPPLHYFGCIAANSKPRSRVSASPRERGPAVTAACHHFRPPPWLARERAKVAPAALCLHCHHRRALPNPSFKPSPNSVARRPSSAGPAAHHALAVQRATLSVPA